MLEFIPFMHIVQTRKENACVMICMSIDVLFSAATYRVNSSLIFEDWAISSLIFEDWANIVVLYKRRKLSCRYRTCAVHLRIIPLNCPGEFLFVQSDFFSVVSQLKLIRNSFNVYHRNVALRKEEREEEEEEKNGIVNQTFFWDSTFFLLFWWALGWN